MRTTYLVCYDICDGKRLRMVFKTMRNWGDHLQYSVFECRLTETDLIRCRHQISEIINHREDQVMNGSEQLLRRLPNDIGGLPAPTIDRIDHELEPWEKRCHALADVLDFHKIINTEEKRRGVEALGAEIIGKLTYYERWIASIETILIEKKILTADIYFADTGRRRANQARSVVGGFFMKLLADQLAAKER